MRTVIQVTPPAIQPPSVMPVDIQPQKWVRVWVKVLRTHI